VPLRQRLEIQKVLHALMTTRRTAADSRKATLRTPRAIFLSYEAGGRRCAERIDLPRSNPAAEYEERLSRSPAAEESAVDRERIATQMLEAEVLVCLIGEDTRRNAWIVWELAQARARTPRIGLVGVTLEPYALAPEAMLNCGAIFVPFKRDALLRAVQWATVETFADGDFELADD
jgi:MTH538 TIR-like domain (DUF1863)